MQLLGLSDIRMTLRYLQVTQQDPQREFQRARQNTTLHSQTPSPPNHSPGSSRALQHSQRHRCDSTSFAHVSLLEDPKSSRKFQSLTQRFLHISHERNHLTGTEK